MTSDLGGADRRDLLLTGSEDAKKVLIDAADSLVDRYNEKVSPATPPKRHMANAQVGCIRSWDSMVKTENSKQYTKDNMHEHFLVIIDNMVSGPDG